ncbi:MAG: hypothetical protein GF320_13995 [Armatimonadia bacterium]|nr:hypothetical protein [Armatimonadia bacterium]
MPRSVAMVSSASAVVSGSSLPSGSVTTRVSAPSVASPSSPAGSSSVGCAAVFGVGVVAPPSPASSVSPQPPRTKPTASSAARTSIQCFTQTTSRGLQIRPPKGPWPCQHRHGLRRGLYRALVSKSSLAQRVRDRTIRFTPISGGVRRLAGALMTFRLHPASRVEDSVSTRTPRAEYPRPHLVRDDTPGQGWLSLNGAWAFRFGDPDGWDGENPIEPGACDREIIVPFPWESFAAWGEDKPGSRDFNEDYLCPHHYLDPADATLEDRRYHQAPRQTVGWYVRTVEVPESLRSARVFLIVGALDYFGTLWVGGKKLAHHEGGYLPFEVDVTDQVDADGRLTIAIRAEDPQDHLDQPAGKQIGWYERVSGIWQSVWLEARPAAHVTAARITPDVEGERAVAIIRIGGDTDAADSVLVEAIDEGGSVVGSATGEGCAESEVAVPVPSPTLWEPEEPYRYTLRVTLRRGDVVVDRVDAPFGMRTVGVGPLPGTDTQVVTFNGKPMYLRGVLAQNFNPFGVYTYPSVAMMRQDIERAKAAGFNMIRIHIKIEDPIFLDLADEMGCLIMYDLPNCGRLTDLSKKRWEATFRGALERDFNHPSIFAWVLFNETWGLGDSGYADDKPAQEWVRSMVHLSRELDPTRLVEDNSPCRYDHVETDINSWHFYINDEEKAKEHIAHVVEQTHPGSEFNYVGGNTQGNEPLMNSEYGGIDAGAGDRDVSWCFHFLTAAQRKYEQICGYVYTELQDIEWERNGLLNYDRSPKEFGYEPSFINGWDCLVLDAPLAGEAEPGATVEVPGLASLFSREEIAATRLGWQVDLTDSLGRTRQAVTEGSMVAVADPYRVTPVGDIAFEMPDEPGLARLIAWLESDTGLILARNWLHRSVGEWVTDHETLRISDPAWEGFENITQEADLWTGGEGHGTVVYKTQLPAAAASARQLTLLAEVSAWRPGYKQTDGDTHPTDVTVIVNGEELTCVTLPDSPCDSRGALSGIAGQPCKYGYRLEVPIKGQQLRAVFAKAPEVEIRLQVKQGAANVGGLCVFEHNSGRYPFGPCLIVGEVKVETPPIPPPPARR